MCIPEFLEKLKTTKIWFKLVFKYSLTEEIKYVFHKESILYFEHEKPHIIQPYFML